VNLQLPNHLFSNHHFQHISIAVHHRPINILYHPQHFPLILSMDHHHIHHLIVYHQTTTVMVLLDHRENITMNNNNINKIFFMIVFFFIWLLLIDNNIYHLMVILHHKVVYGVQLFALLLVSTKFFFFTTCKIHCNSILSILVTRLVTSNYNRFILIALTFLFSHSLPYILQLKVKMCINIHTYEYN
jgi:hypothetical protein